MTYSELQKVPRTRQANRDLGSLGKTDPDRSLITFHAIQGGADAPWLALEPDAQRSL